MATAGILSNDDVFGQASAGGTLSHDDVWAAPAAKPPKAASRSPLNEGVRTATSIADLFTAGPVQGIADVMGQTVGRVVAAAQGSSRKDAIKFGKEFGNDIASHPAINQPLTRLYDWVMKNEPDKTAVDDVMGHVSDLIHKGGKYVQKYTKGAIRADDVDLMSEAVMAGAGGRLQQKVVSRGQPKAGALGGGVLEAPPVRPETPMAAAAKRNVKADVEESTGVKAHEEAEAGRSARRKEARAAFKEDPQYADYLKNYADEEARLRGLRPEGGPTAPGGVPGSGPRTPRTGLRDAVEEKALPRGDQPKVETGAPDALDSALSKVRQGRSFDLTSEERIRLRNGGSAPKFERGSASTSDMAALAAFVGGTAAMQAFSDDPSVVKDIAAGLLASGATRVRPRTLYDTIQAARNSRNSRPLASVGNLAKDREDSIRLAGYDTINTVRRVAKLVPDEAGREKVHAALDTGNVKLLSPREREAHDLLRSEYDRLAKLGLDADTLKEVRRNYATHIWKTNDSTFERLFGSRKGFGTSPNTPYALHRAFATMEEGERAGLVPLSKDAAFVFATYANSLISAVENGRMLKALKEAKTDSDENLVMKRGEAPRQYVAIDNPQMKGLVVHPEIADQMKFVFENPSAAGVTAALEIVADVTKRSAVAGSFFHAKALIDVLMAAVPGKAKYFAGAAAGAAGAYGVASAFGDDHAMREAALGGMIGYVGPRIKAYATGRSEFLKELERGSSSPFLQRAVRSGLMFGSEKGPLVVDDAGRRFYDAMRVVQREADRITQPVGIKGGKGVEAYIKANHWMDDMLWGRLHPAMKMEVWSKQSNIIREVSIRRNAKDPKSRILSEAEADQIAARYTNDLFGGLNWTRMAMDAKTRLGRAVATQLLSPSGRRTMRIMMFAPDWTISTARSALSAIDKDLVNPLKWGNVARGMFQPISRGDLARQYVARSALYYMVVGDAINYSMSGHHLWENDDKIGWSFIDWGDGRKMQFSKHIMETPHWFQHPVQQAIGKLGYVPKETANQMLGTEYLAPRSGKQGQVFAGPRMKDTSAVGRVEHAGKGLIPIPGQSDSLEQFGWGEAGMPIYGRTAEQREQDKRDRAERKRKERK